MRLASIAAAVLAIAALAASLRWGAMVAGGADSYGYVSEAGLLAQRQLRVEQPIVHSTPWPDAAETWAPLGYRPSPHQHDAIVPIYPPGLPLLMAAFQTIGGYCAAFLVVPLCGALAVWLTYLFGRRVAGSSGTGLLAAALVAASPVFLYQLMNAMSDVPVTAFAALALFLAVSDRPAAAGLAMGAAIAIRPNLAPLAVVLGGWLAVTRRRPMRFAIGVAPWIAGLLWLNGVVYESPFVSGYGTADDLYSIRFIGTNVRQFATWLAQVETPAALFAVLYFAAPRLAAPQAIARGRLLVGGWIAAVLLSYLFYQPFDAWWYLRFLLPMWPALMLCAAMALVGLVDRPTSHIAAIIVALLVAARGFYVAADRSAFALGRGERRYVDVARFIASHTEPDAVMFSVQHSGSLRLYAGRMTLRYAVLDPVWLDRAVAHLHALGRHPYFVLDGSEVEEFRRRFSAASRAGALDWQPVATLGSTVFIYDPIARGEATPLAIARSRGARGWWTCDPPQSWPPVLRMK